METSTYGTIRFLPRVRTHHLEMGLLENSTILYRRQSFDFEMTGNALADGKDLRRVSLLGAPAFIMAHRAGTIEVPEPMWYRYLPETLSIIATVRTMDRLFHRQTRIVCYCIENLDPAEACPFGGKLFRKVWTKLARGAVSLCLSSCDRVVFGTEGSQENYRQCLNSDDRRSMTRWKTVVALEAPRLRELAQTKKINNRVCFVGALESRKGFNLVLDAWPSVQSAIPNASLEIVGDGPLHERAKRLVERYPDSVRLIDNATRAQVCAVQVEAAVCVAPSQRTNRWREQVGLPIVEALASGCRVVTTTESGLSTWLSDHGHYVLDLPTSARVVGQATIAALKSKKGSKDVLGDLPKIDGRTAARVWQEQ